MAMLTAGCCAFRRSSFLFFFFFHLCVRHVPRPRLARVPGGGGWRVVGAGVTLPVVVPPLWGTYPDTQAKAALAARRVARGEASLAEAEAARRAASASPGA